MKYALLVGKTLSNGSTSGIKNIGDYMQSLAALQYLPQVDEYYDRDSVNSENQVVKMIMNAWYMWKPELFPVSQRIIPLPISMHISPMIARNLFEIPNVVQWFKKHEPIGCRDTGTEKLLKAHGIDSYFSGCLTLTLGKKYISQGNKRGLVFVDPYIARIFSELNLVDCFSILFAGIVHFRTWMKIAGKFLHTYCIDGSGILRRLFYSACLIKTYGKLFSMKELREAQYITHMIKVGEGTLLNTEEKKLEYTESLLKIYASSKMIVTGRIHCALPCLGLETPVLFTDGIAFEEKSPLSSSGRFGGLIELFNVVHVKKSKLVDIPSVLPLRNKDTYKQFAIDLEKKCEAFVSNSVV